MESVLAIDIISSFENMGSIGMYKACRISAPTSVSALEVDSPETATDS